MAKIKSTLTGPARGQAEAYKRIHRSESCVGPIADGTDVHIQTSRRPLSAFVESDSLRSVVEYDWKTGTYARRQLDIVENARRQIRSLKVRPVTNGHHVPSEEMPNYGIGMAVASTPAPASTSSSSLRKKKKRG